MFVLYKRRFTVALLLIVLLASIASGAGAGGATVKWISGEPFVAMRDLASYYGMKYSRTDSKTVELRSRWSRIRFNVKSRLFKLNGISVWLHEGPRPYHGDWLITRADAQRLIDPVLASARYLKSGIPRVVVLDPGHGGKDKGATGSRNVQEKLAVLDIAKRARSHLKGMGIKALLTREGDKFISLNRRVQLASKWDADLFVSIHLNASQSSSAHGVETYILTSPGFPSTNTGSRKRVRKLRYPGTSFDHRSTVAGYAIHKNLLAKTGAADRGLREARFFVLKNVTCPAVLVEGAFLSNPAEQRKILDSNYRDAIAKGIAYGVLEYLNEYRRAHLKNP